MPDDPKPTGAASLTALDNGLANVADDPRDLESLTAPDKPPVQEYDDEPDAPEPEPPSPAPEAPVATAPIAPTNAPANVPPNVWDDPSNPYYQAFQQAQISQAVVGLDQHLQRQGVADEATRRALIGIAVREHGIEQQARTTVLSKASEELKTLGFDFTPQQLGVFETPAALQTFLSTMRTQKRAEQFTARKESGADSVDSSSGSGAEAAGSYNGGMIAQGLRELDRRSGRR